MIQAWRDCADWMGVRIERHATSRRLAGILLATMVAVSAAAVSAQSRNALLSVRLTVVRSCAVDTRAGTSQAVTVTCSRGATPGVISTTTSTTVQTAAAVTERSTMDVPLTTEAAASAPLALPLALDGLDEPQLMADASVTFELVTINF